MVVRIINFLLITAGISSPLLMYFAGAPLPVYILVYTAFFTYLIVYCIFPELKKYPHLKGNFGTAWQNQQKEFADLPAPVLYTTNCLTPVKQSYQDRVFTTAVVSYPGMTHIGEEKDFTPVIEKALRKHFQRLLYYNSYFTY